MKFLKRLHPHTRGRWSERLAILPYLLRGHRPLPGRQLPAQVDILLIRRRHITLVEVKYRASALHRPYSLHPAQQQRLKQAARALSAHYPGHTFQADAVLVSPHYPWLKRISHAFPLA